MIIKKEKKMKEIKMADQNIFKQRRKETKKDHIFYCLGCGKKNVKSETKKPPEHVFCSKDCKDSWCFDIQKGKIKIEN